MKDETFLLHSSRRILGTVFFTMKGVVPGTGEKITSSVRMTPQEARELARELKLYAKQAEEDAK